MLNKIHCLNCGKEDFKKDKKVIFCSIGCRNRYPALKIKPRIQSRNCPICKKVFKPANNHIQTCSVACGHERQKVSLSKAMSKKWDPLRIKKNCVICSKEFSVFASRWKTKSCSSKCGYLASSQWRTNNNYGFQKGHVPCVLSPEAQKRKAQKLSIANKGKRNSPKTEFKKGHSITENFRKVRAKLKGVNAPGYKHGKPKCTVCKKDIAYEAKNCQRHQPGVWKGGITPINKLIRSSKEYKLWRKSVFERDNYTCQFCKVRGGTLQADHIKPFAYYPELRFSLDNGRTLCVECHKKTDTYKARAKKLYHQSAPDASTTHSLPFIRINH